MAPISCSRHQFCEFGNRGVRTDPVDALVHRVFDFHGGPPLLELGTLDEMQRPRPSIFTVQWIRSAGLLGLSGGRAQSGVGIEVLMTLHEQSWNPKRKKWPCSLTAPISTPPPSRSVSCGAARPRPAEARFCQTRGRRHAGASAASTIK